MSARHCSACGKPLTEGFAFCPYCGSRAVASTLGTPDRPFPAGTVGPYPQPGPATPATSIGPQPARSARGATYVFVTMVLVVFAFTIYIVLVDKDLTALLIGILIVVILYGIIRFVGSLSRRVS